MVASRVWHDTLRTVWQGRLRSRVKGLKTASTEPGRLHERRSNEVNSTSTAVAGEQEVHSVRGYFKSGKEQCSNSSAFSASCAAAMQ